MVSPLLGVVLLALPAITNGDEREAPQITIMGFASACASRAKGAKWARIKTPMQRELLQLKSLPLPPYRPPLLLLLLLIVVVSAGKNQLAQS